MPIPIDTVGRILNGDKSGHYVRVQRAAADSGSFQIFEWWTDSNGPNGGGAFDDWVEDAAALAEYFAETGWIVDWAAMAT